MMRKKLHTKGILSQEYFDLVDWDAIKDAQMYYPNGFSLWIAKHVTGFCGVGKMLFRWGHWTNNHCPCCDMECETSRHILVCRDEEMATEFHNSVEVLELWMMKVDTCPEIADCIVTTIAQHQPSCFSRTADPLITDAATEQDNIGWTNFMEGKISKLWRVHQRKYYSATGSRKTSRAWAYGLVR